MRKTWLVAVLAGCATTSCETAGGCEDMPKDSPVPSVVYSELAKKGLTEVKLVDPKSCGRRIMWLAIPIEQKYPAVLPPGYGNLVDYDPIAGTVEVTD